MKRLLLIALLILVIIVTGLCARKVITSSGDEVERPGQTASPAPDDGAPDSQAQPSPEPSPQSVDGGAAPAEATPAEESVFRLLAPDPGMPAGTKAPLWYSNDVPIEDVPLWYLDSVYESLLYIPGEDQLDIRGCLAENWYSSEDSLVWTFKIRQNARFSDGTVCDAAAVKAAWDRAAQNGMFDGDGMAWEAVDSGTFTVRLSEPISNFEQITACYGGYTNRNAIPISSDSGLGTGPFALESFDSGKGMVLTKNTYYDFEPKAPLVDRVEIVFYESGLNMTALDLLEKEDADAGVFCAPAPDSAGKEYTGEFMEKAEKMQEKGYSVLCSYPRSMQVCFGDGTELLSRQDFRKALSLLVDNSQIDRELYRGWGREQRSIFSEWNPAYAEFEGFGYDPEEANVLLAGMGVDLTELELSQRVTSDVSAFFLEMARQLEEAGLNIETEVLGPQYSFTPLFDGGWALYPMSNAEAATNPWNGFAIYFLTWEERFADRWKFLLGQDGYSELEQLYTSSRDPGLSYEEQVSLLRQLTTQVQEEYLALPGVQKPDVCLVSDTVAELELYTGRHFRAPEVKLYSVIMK